MGLKMKIGMAMATSAAGAAMLVGGSFALFTNQAQAQSETFTAGTLKVGVSNNGQMTRADAGTFKVNNLAPGDNVQDSFTVTNTGSLSEWVALESTPSNGGTTGLFSSFTNSIDASANQNGGFHGLSDQGNAGAGQTVYGTNTTGPNQDFTSDVHPATYSYQVVVPGTSTVLASEAATSQNDWSQAYNHAFLLAPGASATVTYTVSLPIAAHNDYQGLSGSVGVEVDAVQARNNWMYTTGPNAKQDETGPAPTTAASGSIMPYSWQPDTGN